jgi:2-oxoglutarate dehydrogenase E1 component
MQMLAFDRRPLIVMTPKSLLRHPEAISSFDELAEGAFLEVLPDANADSSRHANVERVIVTSGKVYFDLLDYRRKNGFDDTPVIRVEQLYPFPSQQMAAEFARYPALKSVVWCQEESRNQGAWSFVEPQLRALLPSHAKLSYEGSAASASTAPGYQSVHAARHAKSVASAFAK